MAKYLYAASVQGIQSFIFATDKLKEIIGASELVEQICTQLFEKKVKKISGGSLNYEQQIVVSAAGNIKMLFTEEQKSVLEALYRDFPMEVVKLAPGITISQTVVSLKGEHLSQDDIDAAERQLQAKRNEAALPTTQAWMIAQRVPSTGLPRISNRKNAEDLPAKAKTRMFRKTNNPDAPQEDSLYGKFLRGREFKDGYGFFTDFNQVAKKKQDNTWMAVIHADGNDFGKILPLFSSKYNAAELKDQFREFSKSLDEATRLAAHEAFLKIYSIYLKESPNKEQGQPKAQTAQVESNTSPEDQEDDDSKQDDSQDQDPVEPLLFRPVVLGGDDITVIMHAEYAMQFTAAYLEAFTKHTKEKFSKFADKFPLLENGLTACAGVAFVKFKYPMHYALDLAESLCSQAKTAAKERAKKEKGDPASNSEPTPACLSFYKMESAFVRSYAEIEQEELTAQVLIQEGNPQDNVLAKYAPLQLSSCPYYLDKGNDDDKNKDRPTIKQLMDHVRSGIVRPAVASRLRQVLGRLHEDSVHQLDQELFRIEQVQRSREQNFVLEKTFGLEVGNLANGGYFQKMLTQGSAKPPKTHLFDVLALLSVDTKG